MVHAHIFAQIAVSFPFDCGAKISSVLCSGLHERAPTVEKYFKRKFYTGINIRFATFVLLASIASRGRGRRHRRHRRRCRQRGRRR